MVFDISEIEDLVRSIRLYAGHYYIEDSSGYGVSLIEQFAGDYDYKNGFKGFEMAGNPINVPYFAKTQTEKALKESANIMEEQILGIIGAYCNSTVTDEAIEKFKASYDTLDSAIKAARRTTS